MKRSLNEFGTSTAFKALHATIFLIAMASFTLRAANVWAMTAVLTDDRVFAGSDQSDNHWQLRVTARTRPPRRLAPTLLEPLPDTSSPFSVAHAAYVDRGRGSTEVGSANFSTTSPSISTTKMY